MFRKRKQACFIGSKATCARLKACCSTLSGTLSKTPRGVHHGVSKQGTSSSKWNLCKITRLTCSRCNSLLQKLRPNLNTTAEFLHGGSCWQLGNHWLATGSYTCAAALISLEHLAFCLSLSMLILLFIWTTFRSEVTMSFSHVAKFQLRRFARVKPLPAHQTESVLWSRHAE